MPTGGSTPLPEYQLVFDGGSLNNPEFGYGSYLLMLPADGTVRRRLEFGHGVTNNQAEYMALLAGLRHLLEILSTRELSPSRVSLEVRGDSNLVIKQLSGLWRVRNPGLQPLYQEARQLLDGFGRVKLEWTPRAHSVRLLGH